jgi:hypothetical protein
MCSGLAIFALPEPLFVAPRGHPGLDAYSTTIIILPSSAFVPLLLGATATDHPNQDSS